MDIALAEKSAITYILKQNKNLDKISFINPEIVRFNLYLAFSKKISANSQQKDLAEKHAKEFSAELEKFKNTKEYKDILAKYDE